MQEIIQLIEKRSEQLSQNPFCRWILGENSSVLTHEETFSFTPSMLYFILGFRDILQHLEYENPKTELEAIINRHCEEDKNHWKWYLADLKTLGFNEASWGSDWSQMVERLWHDDNKATRDLVYLCIHLIKKHQTPEASLVIIECLESTFGVFMTTLKNRFGHSSIYKRLQFFGQTHQDQEMNHSIGHWIEDGDEVSHSHSNGHHLANILLTDADEQLLSHTVNQIFDQFELVFKTWLDLKNAYIHSSKDIQSSPSSEQVL